jgi:hypothetical protein
MAKFMTNTELLNKPNGIERTKNKVAIVGCGNTYNHVERLFPNWDKYEIWGLNQLYRIYPKIVDYADRWFQIHHEDKFLEGDQGTFDWLKEVHPFPVYVREKYIHDYQSAVPFPKHELVEEFGTYWTSCVAWMMGLAIYEGFEEIHLYGVHFAMDDEYALQKDGLEYYIGLAKGRGIKVFIPPTCEILKSPFMYGFEDPSHLFHKIMLEIKDHDRKIKEVEVKRNLKRDRRNQIWGGLNLSYKTEDEKAQAQVEIKEIIKDDWLLNNELNQLQGSKGTYEYLKKHWLCKWYLEGEK